MRKKYKDRYMKLEDIKSIKIGAYDYRVRFPYIFTERIDLSGQSDHIVLEIRIINKDQNGNEYNEVKLISILFHEILHCIDHVAGWAIDKVPLEEKIEIIAQGLTQVFRDNPGLTEVLTSYLQKTGGTV